MAYVQALKEKNNAQSKYISDKRSGEKVFKNEEIYFQF